MQTVQSAHILSVATCLSAEALCISAVLDGQILLVENHITVDIRYGHLCSGNQVEVIYLAVIHLSFLVRQLTCSIS